jgi:hypothetical protein
MRELFLPVPEYFDDMPGRAVPEAVPERGVVILGEDDDDSDTLSVIVIELP